MQGILKVTDLKFSWSPQNSVFMEIPSLVIESGEKLFLHGPSGTGKSTLLNLVAGVLPPQSGDILLLGHNIPKLSTVARDQLRGDHMGFIFQMFNLLPYMSPLENVLLPCQFSKLKAQKVKSSGQGLEDEALRLLGRLGLESHRIAGLKTRELSVGQQQRVATARALMGQPELIIADEPTSALDAAMRDRFLELLFEECDLSKAALLFVSHDQGLGRHFDRQVGLAELNQAKTH